TPERFGHKLVINRLAGCSAQIPFPRPYIIRNPIRSRLLRDALTWQPERRLDVPGAINPRDPDLGGQVINARKVKPAVDRAIKSRPHLAAAGRPHRPADER